MTFGQQNTAAEGHAQMDYAVDRGITICEAAELYPIPPKSETQGRTEAIIGTWLASRKACDKVMVATKAIGRTKMDWLRKDRSPGRQSRAQLMEAWDRSLKRLKTDCIDLYQLLGPTGPCVSSRASTMCILKATPIRCGSGQDQVRRAFQRDPLGV
jgi:aryl-alcohol dehydrogenase-like predicted oxidoreductase